MSEETAAKPAGAAKSETKIETKAETKAESRTKGKSSVETATEADGSASYSRGERQKPISKAYKDNWDRIFGKKRRKR